MKISPPYKRVLLVSFSSLYLVGLSYWLTQLFLRKPGGLAEEPHFLERYLGPIHLGAALIFIFVVGMIWAQHVGPSLRLPKRRVTGWVIFALLALQGLSAITILYGSELWIHRAEQLHPWFGASLLPFLALHWKKGSKGLKRQRTSG